MNKKAIHSEQAPQAIGPYSQAIRCDNTLYLSGQIPLDPNTMELVEGDIQTQAKRVFDNLQAILQAAGADLNRVVKLNIYLTDLAQFAQVNDIMQEVFDQPYPARATLGVKALPKGAQIEMDAVAVLDNE